MPAPSHEQLTFDPRVIERYPATQPPSLKPPQFRKSQLLRQYQSMLRSTPLMLLFQHNNLKASEWVGIKRELAAALLKIDEELAKGGDLQYVGSSTRMQVVQTGIFASALKVVEFWKPKTVDEPRTKTSGSVHGLSAQARHAGRKKNQRHGLEPLLSGPIAALQLPAVSPQHLKAALSILAPSKDIPAPKRRTNPTYHEPAVQNGIAKLMLLGARVDGQAFDFERARWVASIQGGLGGLQAQLVHVLQGVGSTLTTALDSAGRSLYLTIEGRRTMLEDDGKSEAPADAS